MALLRIVYFSENRIGVMSRTRRMRDLQKQAIAKNTVAKLSGALAHDDLWFIQVLEGEEATVKSTFDRILKDPRHANVSIVSKGLVPSRLFGDWSMGFASKSRKTEHLFGTHWYNKGMNPSSMTEMDILKLMHVLTAEGHMSGGGLAKAKAA